MIPITTMNILLQLCANTQLKMFNGNLKQYPFHVREVNCYRSKTEAKVIRCVFFGI